MDDETKTESNLYELETVNGNGNGNNNNDYDKGFAMWVAIKLSIFYQCSVGDAMLIVKILGAHVVYTKILGRPK